MLASCRAVGGTIRDRDPLHPQRVCLPFIFRRVKTGMACQQLGRPPQPLLMQAHRSQQQGRVGRPPPTHGIVGNNLILGFLNLHQLAELGGLVRFALADDFRRGFEHADDLAGCVGDAPKNSRGGLSQHLVEQRNHRIQLLFHPPKYRLLFRIHRSLHAAVDLLQEPLRLVPHLPRQAHQLPVFLLHLRFLLLALAPAEPGNFHHPVSYRSQPIPQSCPLRSHQVADLFHQSQHHFGRRGIPPPLPTLRVPPPELLVDQIQQLFVFQDLVGFLIHASIRDSASRAKKTSPRFRWLCRSRTMGPPGSGFFFLALPPRLLAVASRQADGACPKLRSGGMSTAGLRDAIGRHVQRAAATLLGPGDIEVGAVAAINETANSLCRGAGLKMLCDLPRLGVSDQRQSRG